ncbi:unnamed protein product [Bursaphelenchus xylophilus]|uniref:(pine wood nematode) hypothetical protein n=1 Tax=Bursaphelenchus xylophilus TaxID=6326 RepID=A0A1I7STY3_BURXY|nr:unnamed protein product [Bursaphelenchus xylophilus]CAG9107812.1 unnamed protein product [Bursaphelenchus xylophilus]
MSSVLPSLLLVVMVGITVGQKAYPEDELRVCELTDLETLSLSKCELEGRIAELENKIREIEDTVMSQGNHVHVKGEVAKRKNEFIRFGKRSLATVLDHMPHSRWNPHSDNALRSLSMVKRKNEFIRFG